VVAAGRRSALAAPGYGVSCPAFSGQVICG
jgi:hypothetical protein